MASAAEMFTELGSREKEMEMGEKMLPTYTSVQVAAGWVRRQ